MKTGEPLSGTHDIDWHQCLQSGDHLVCSHMTSEPAALLESLAQSGVDVPLSIDLGVPFTLAAQSLPGSCNLETLGGMGTARQLARTHALSINRTGYRDAVAAYASGKRRADVVLVSLARAADGTLTLGASHGSALAAAANARTVIAEVNRAAPAMHGERWPDELTPDLICELDYPLITAPETRAGPAEIRIAQQLAELISNGACLEVGIGAMPSAVLAALTDHKRLGLHSGMFTDAMLRLVQTGAVDNSNKPADARFACIGGAYGSTELYGFVDDNPLIRLASTEITHGPQLLAAIPRFTAINSALEVDLLGRANAETIGKADGTRVQIGGIGGLRDFVNGGLASPEGLSIISLTARTRDDDSGQSRIVPTLAHEITLDEDQADIVVTEFGIARLRGRSRRERVAQMVQIAHPDHRDYLRNQARSLALAD